MAWQKQGLPRLSIAVNLTARQFTDEHLLQDVVAILDATGMDADLLELEIHESLLMRDVKKTLRVLTGLKEAGVRIAIDDFGIGYSSLIRTQAIPARYNQNRPFVHPRNRRCRCGTRSGQGHHRDGPDAEPDGRGAGR